MATSWQYNTSANMGPYGSVTALPSAPMLSTSNSHYGSWIGLGTAPRTAASPPRTPMRVLGNVPTSAGYSTSHVSTMMGHQVPDPKEKFSSLANKFGAGRILTPITSQYDRIMQEEEELLPKKRYSKTPINSPDLGVAGGVSATAGHVTAVDISKLSPRDMSSYARGASGGEDIVKDTFENGYDARSGYGTAAASAMASRRPGFERSQTLISASSSTSSSSSLSSKPPNVGVVSGGYTYDFLPAGRPSNVVLNRSNTFTAGDLANNRYGTNYNKSLNLWKHEPHPPSSQYAATSSDSSSASSILIPTAAAAAVTAAAAVSPSSVRPMPPQTSNTTYISQQINSATSITPGSAVSSRSASPPTTATLSLTDVQRAADPQRSLSSDSSTIRGHLDSSPVVNGMYWLYGSRGKPPPTPFRPSTYMYRMDTESRFGPRSNDAYSAYDDRSPTSSPRCRPYHNHISRTVSVGEPDVIDARLTDMTSASGAQAYNAATGFQLDSKLADRGAGAGTKKSILKKNTSYGAIPPLFTDMGGVPRTPGLYTDLAGNPLPPLSRAAQGSPIKVRGSGSGKRVTFKLTPRTVEISPREDRERDILSMFSGFRFDPSLLEYTES